MPKRPKISQDVISAESALERLAQSLGSSVDGFTVERVVALSLGMRGWSLYRGFRHALTGSTLDAERRRSS